MSLKHYGVLKGNAIDRRLASGSNPHYQVHVVGEQSRLDRQISGISPSEQT